MKLKVYETFISKIEDEKKNDKKFIKKNKFEKKIKSLQEEVSKTKSMVEDILKILKKDN